MNSILHEGNGSMSGAYFPEVAEDPEVSSVAPELQEPDEDSYSVKLEDLELRLGRPLTLEEQRELLETGHITTVYIKIGENDAA